MKAIPKSLNPEPYTKHTKTVGLRPPSFRTAVHRPLDQSDPKRPPSFETGYRETPLGSPGYAVEASDRTYVTTPEGSIRRADGGRRKPEKPETRQQAKARERIEAELQKRDRRRLERFKVNAARLRARADAAIGRAKKVLRLQGPTGEIGITPAAEALWSGNKLTAATPAGTLQGNKPVSEILLEGRE